MPDGSFVCICKDNSLKKVDTTHQHVLVETFAAFEELPHCKLCLLPNGKLLVFNGKNPSLIFNQKNLDPESTFDLPFNQVELLRNGQFIASVRKYEDEFSYEQFYLIDGKTNKCKITDFRYLVSDDKKIKWHSRMDGHIFIGNSSHATLIEFDKKNKPISKGRSVFSIDENTCVAKSFVNDDIVMLSENGFITVCEPEKILQEKINEAASALIKHDVIKLENKCVNLMAEYYADCKDKEAVKLAEHYAKFYYASKNQTVLEEKEGILSRLRSKFGGCF